MQIRKNKQDNQKVSEENINGSLTICNFEDGSL